MKDLVPIRVKIGLRPNGYADHPDWSQLPLAASENPKDHMPYGWHYDKQSGHSDDSPGSPFGVQYGMLLVTEKFADEAEDKFPDLIERLNETEAQTFWEDRARKHMPDNGADMEVMQCLQIELDLREKLGQNTTALKVKIAKALDPNDNTEPGLKKDPQRYWADAKRRLGFQVKARQARKPTSER